MEFKTNISTTRDGIHEIYGKSLEDLIREATFTEAIFLLFAGHMPNAAQRALLDAMLVAASEHGIEAPSAYVPRISVASGNEVHTGIAAGILAIGSVHGGAGEAAAEFLSQPEDAETLVARAMERGERIPGFGHKVYTDADPRATIIYEKAKESGLPLAAFDKAYAIEAALEKAKGKKLPLNIDGALAAGTLTLGLRPAAAKALFVLARVAGMGAHALEEAEQKKSYYRLSQ